MRNVIPGFISSMVHRQGERGSFHAAVLNVDIAGFTSITEHLPLILHKPGCE